MIRIVKGTYGMRQGNRLVSVTSESDPIELSESQEKRLVACGVAEYVTCGTGTNESESEVMEEISYDEKALSAMSYNNLRSLAKDLELDTTGTKEEIIDRILESETEDEAPVLEAAEPEEA